MDRRPGCDEKRRLILVDSSVWIDYFRACRRPSATGSMLFSETNRSASHRRSNPLPAIDGRTADIHQPTVASLPDAC
jgi:hypothetical protein